MIVRLALAAHSKLVGAMLDMGLQHGEAAFKQHIALQVCVCLSVCLSPAADPAQMRRQHQEAAPCRTH